MTGMKQQQLGAGFFTDGLRDAGIGELRGVNNGNFFLFYMLDQRNQRAYAGLGFAGAGIKRGLIGQAVLAGEII